VEIRLIHATGPLRGQTAHSQRVKMRTMVFGHNVVTGFVPNLTGPIYSGRDLMRRFLLQSTFPESLSGDEYKVGNIELGSGSTAESSSDSQLASAISGSLKAVTEIELDSSNPYITFTAQWDESEVNVAISEAMLWSTDNDPNDNHPYARKTFTSFTKTSDFTLQVRWSIRF